MSNQAQRQISKKRFQEVQHLSRLIKKEILKLDPVLNQYVSVSQVKRLKQAATEALKSKEDTEIKCQHKISDMVALMDKHKVQAVL